MQEMRDLSSTIRATVAALREETKNAHNDFVAEVANAKSNISKVRSMTAELKGGNQEMEALLGETKSNYPPEPADINGVVVNKIPVP